MNKLAFIWAAFIRFVPKIIEFIKIRKWAKNIPGPSIAELIENAKKGQSLAWLRELSLKYGSVFRIWFGKDLMVYFTDPEDIKQLLTNNALLYKSKNYDILKPWLGRGLLTSGGESWYRRRKLITPAFHFGMLSEYKESIEENCKILISKLREKSNGQEFDVYPDITLFALDVICETAMGIKKHAQMQSDSEYVKAVQKICRILSRKSFSFWQRMNIFFKFTKAGRERDAALKTLHNETNRVIKHRRKMLQICPDLEISEGGSKRRLAFLDILLLSQMEGVAISDREIREEVDTFMFEGHDTTRSALGFSIYLLSQHAEIQQKAYEESLASKGREQEAMPYIAAIIKETLRLYPAVPFFSRMVTEDLQVGSLTVPKGVSVSVLTFMVHRNEKDFPNPDMFDPTRFLNNSNDPLNPFSFLAFSAGPRNCIGQKFAMLELKYSLSHLLRNFEFLPANNFRPKPLMELVMKSENGIRVKIKTRK